LINKGVARPDANLVDNVVMTASNCFSNYQHLRLQLEKKQLFLGHNTNIAYTLAQPRTLKSNEVFLFSSEINIASRVFIFDEDPAACCGWDGRKPT
jgi:hypothetical protein